MKAIKALFTIFFLLTLISSCRKDTMITETEVIPPIPQTNIETTINGFVTERSGEPLADASVKILNKITQTNELGFFELTGLVNEKFAVIEVSKAGYFNQYETIRASRTSDNRTRIQLTERILTGITNAASGGMVDIEQGTFVEFKPNSFIDENGNPYNGVVNVYAFYIDPTDEHIDQIMPGNLVGVNTEDELQVLQSFGMVNVELESENGQKLNINQPATLTVNVPASIENNAPAEIPLWYFDEETGLWEEEGSATLSNGRYVGDVTHFTIWNCDDPSNTTFVSGQLVDNRGVSISRVKITDLSTGASITDWTDSNGVFENAVPSDGDLLLEILSFCGDEVLFETNIGPFTEDYVDLGIFDISNNSNFSFLSGTMVDCDQVPLANAVVFFNLPNQSLNVQTTTNENGYFSALLPTCEGEEIRIRGLNSETGFVSQPVNTLPSSTIDLGDVVICTDVSSTLGSVVMNVDGEQKVFDNCTVTVGSSNDGMQYIFVYNEEIAPDKFIYYYWIIYDENSDLNNPSWDAYSISYSPPEGADQILYTKYTPSFQPGVGSIVVDQEAVNTGDMMQVSFSNISIGKRINDPNGPNILETFPGSSMTITAVLQP